MPTSVGNGNVRHRFRGEAGLDGAALLAAAKAQPHVIASIAGRPIVKEVVIPGRLVNFVVCE